jgi:hypothetical protein
MRCKCCFKCKYIDGRACFYICKKGVIDIEIANPKGIVCKYFEEDKNSTVSCENCEERENWIEHYATKKIILKCIKLKK